MRIAGLQPTDEQQAVVDLARTNTNIVVDALAGTGKTSTLAMVARAVDGKGQYIAFNKAIVNDSKSAFPTQVDCRTAHSLAFMAVGREYQHRLDGPRMTNPQLAQHLGCTPIPYASTLGDQRYMSPVDIARTARQAVETFCKTADERPGPRHITLPIIVDDESPSAGELAAAIQPHVDTIWDDRRDPGGRLPFTHDHYLKMWQLTDPTIPADYIMFDEAQDADPVMLAVVNAQDAQLIFCGDRFQSIYEWRGAINAMEHVDVDHHRWLTRSFRFGDPIAKEANLLLDRLKAPKAISTNGNHSTVRKISRPDALLCRTNGGVMEGVIRALELSLHPAIAGGATDLIRFAEACEKLQQGQRTSHPDLAPFANWNEVNEWIAADRAEAGVIATMVKLVDDYGPAQLVAALQQCTDELNADITISTVHKAKGREWPTVKFASDFLHVDDMDPEELRLAYVGVTRARQQLDLTSWWAVEPTPTPPTSTRSARGQRR